ncbi:MAG: hypothetical protein L6R40_003402 [Gallowayella cf. fulva]|nr:MAG: hypothetical protein L6R40_003402 [Xanthomendoza cf. fulva]
MADTTQQLDEEDCTTPRQSTTITLQYPSLPVTGTPDSWLSKSLLVSMASNQDEGSVRSIDDATSSLGDSAYDFIDDNSFATTDDEELASTERISLPGNMTRGASDNQDLERTLSTESVYPHPSESMVKARMRNSTASLTSEEDLFSRDSSIQPPQQPPANQQGPSSIKFQEIHHGEAVFPLAHASAPQDFALTVRQYMLDQDLSLEAPYRLLYVGDVAARERIVAKIGAALAATVKAEAHRPLRYSVIPMPSSDDPLCSSDPVLLDWSGHEIIVYQCVNASFCRSDSGHDTIELIMDGNAHVRSFRTGSKFEVSEGWEYPDIAIFYLSDRDSISARQTRRFARSFVARHKIPTIVVNEQPAWDRPLETMTIERLTPHVCLQTKADTASSSLVVKRLPIDLSTFTQLDALQLNRNLAYLNLAYGTRRSRQQDKRNAKPGGWLPVAKADVLNTYFSWSDALASRLGTAMPALSYVLGFLAIASIYVASSFMIGQLSAFPVRSLDYGVHVNTTVSSTLVSTSSAKGTVMVPSTSKPTTPQCLSLAYPAMLVTSQRLLTGKSRTDLATLLESTPITINKSENFQVHVLGDAHIVLRPPHWFTRLRRAPKLNINITQGDRVLKHQLSILFDGVYALELSSDEAHGPINIAVWTESKPKIHENLQADFGNSWLHVAAWKRAVNAISDICRQDIELVQTSLSHVYTRRGAELHSLMQKTLEKAKGLKAESQRIGQASMTRIAGTTDRILASTRYGSLKISWLLNKQKEFASREVSLEVEKLRRKISSYVSAKAYVARIYAEAAPSAYRAHLRNSQKKALKIWWSMRGLPQQRPVTIVAKGRSRSRGSCGGRFKKPAVSR